MADQRSSNDLSPSLQAVLSSLSINLEDELNRYRRNRLTYRSPADDVFADLEDAVFTEIDAVEPVISVPITVPTVSISSAPIYPPALPPNKKLSASVPTTVSAPIVNVPAARAETPINVSTDPSGLLARVSTRETAFLGGSSAEESSVTSEMGDRAREAEISSATISSISPGSHLSSDYLASSEKLIESLSEVPPMPEPIDITFKPRRKTVSLLAGATLGLFGLIAGLAASYLMSNPVVVQRLANRLKREPAVVATTSKDTFDPPGPDLSAQEFIDIDIDNLSSLNMPQTAINPSSAAASTSLTALPPISGQINASSNSQSSSAQTVTQPNSALPTATQAAIIPVGSHYYVTVPFTTEQGLADLRQSVAEAFVRQFSTGNLVQLAAFDNPEAAQQFIEELKVKGVAAQLYGPTTE